MLGQTAVIKRIPLSTVRVCEYDDDMVPFKCVENLLTMKWASNEKCRFSILGETLFYHEKWKFYRETYVQMGFIGEDARFEWKSRKWTCIFCTCH